MNDVTDSVVAYMIYLTTRQALSSKNSEKNVVISMQKIDVASIKTYRSIRVSVIHVSNMIVWSDDR